MAERVAYVQRIDPDRREEYIEAHDNVPESVTEAMARAGVEWFDLYLREDVAVCVLSVEDVDAYVAEMSDDLSVEEWERHTARFKREGVDVDAAPDEQLPLMDRIWSFEPE